MHKTANATKCLIDKMSNFSYIKLNFVDLDILSVRHFVALNNP